MPHLHRKLHARGQASEWIDYLCLVVTVEQRVRETLARAKEAAEKLTTAPYLVTPPPDDRRAIVRRGRSYQALTTTSTSWAA